MATKKKMLQAAAGNAGGAGGAGLDVESVFSTYLYEGNGGVQTINNGIALGASPDDGVYYLSSPSSLTGNNSAVSSVSATVDGTITLNSSTTKFASNSYDFDGASNLRLSRALIDTSSSFCFETWVYFNSTGVSNDMAMLLAQYKSGEDGRLLFGAQGGNLVARYNGSSVAITAPVSASQWHHVAWSYDGTTHRLFIDGTLEDSTTTDFPIYTGVTTQIGGTDSTLLTNYDLDGYMEDIRITTGDARYTASFTPPTASHPVTTAVTAGEGGLVWLKQRSAVNNHMLFDTERGNSVALSSNNTGANNGPYTNFGVTSYNSSGFSLGSAYASEINNSGQTYASWTFRKAPKFFDVVTYTGDGNNNRQISHNLGTTVGCMIVKRTDTTKNWRVYHRAADASPEEGYLTLNSTAAWFDELANGYSQNQSKWWYTAPTSTEFTVSSDVDVNASGGTYVAYLFAHNDGDGEFGPDGDADIIKCGSYTGTGVANDLIETLGFEPQWMLVKRTDTASDWIIVDSMRGAVAGGDVYNIYANESNAEVEAGSVAPDAVGIRSGNVGGWGESNASGGNYIYIAIRRGTKVPESGTEVFEPTAYTGNNTANRTVGSLTVDMNIIMDRTKTAEDNNLLFDRMRGQDVVLKTDETSGEGNGWGGTYYNLDQQHGFSNGSNTSFLNNSSANYISYIWKRAPNFFDVVAYSGNSNAGQTVSHNLGVAPEMMIVKRRTTSGASWTTYVSDLGATKYLRVNNTNAAATSSGFWYNTAPTSSVFTVGGDADVNGSGEDYIAYLFASLPGISKVGSYTGNDGTQTIDCGFTSGARFILIKRTDGNSNWYIWDTERGINVASDPYLELDTTNAENPGQDEIDAHASGFIINNPGGSGDAEINKSGKTYIFYAIA